MLDAEKQLDHLETMLLMALSSGKKNDDEWHSTNTFGKDKLRLLEQDAGVMLNFNERNPASAYTLDLSDSRRLYAATPDGLVHHPLDIIGESLEIFFFNDEKKTISWFGLYPSTRRIKNLSVLGRAYGIAELHCKVGSALSGEWVNSYQRAVAFNKKGASLPVKIMGAAQGASARDGATAILACSVAEDANRANCAKASVSLNSEIVFPICMDSYQEFFKLRDAPNNTPTGRKNPILHWTKAHFRKKRMASGLTKVKGYKKGVDVVTINDISAKVELL